MHQFTMDDLNALYYFAAVVQHHGFSAAARATGVEKTRLSRRVAELERRLGVRLLQRSTRTSPHRSWTALPCSVHRCR